MRRTFNLLILLFLWMKASEGSQSCKQYLSYGSSSYSIYYCTYYCCGSLYDDDCCYLDPGSSWSSWTTSSPLSSRGSSSKLSPSIVARVVGYSILGIASLLVSVCSCLALMKKKKNRVQSYPRNLDTHRTVSGMTSSKQYPGTTGPTSTPASAAGTPAQSALPGMIHV